jgi:hypothetical protein
MECNIIQLIGAIVIMTEIVTSIIESMAQNNYIR